MSAAKSRSGTERSSRQSPTARRWFVWLALIVVPVALLLAAEGLLRVTGFGYRTGFFTQRQVGERLVWTDNQDFGKRFFPPGLVRYPNSMTFPVAKEPGTVRIFVLGESAALGDPDPKFGLPRMLEVLLQERYPQRKIEVVNAAMVAINSHVILPIARECARRDGDLWVVYMGNNEIIGPYGAITPFGAEVPAVPLVRAGVAMKQLRIGQLVDRTLRWAQRASKTPAAWGGMAMWADQQVHPTDVRSIRVRQAFARNLDDIVEIGRKAGVPILLCTVAANLKDCAPFRSLNGPGLTVGQRATWEADFKKGVSLEAQGDLDAALDAYQRAFALDDDHSELCFRVARCHLKLGNLPEADRHFRKARDLDALQFRADSAINVILRKAAAAHTTAGVHLLDADRLFAENAPQGIPGQESFYEHVHFTPEGNYLLARAVAERAAAVLGLTPGTPALNTGLGQKTGNSAAVSDSWLSPAECLRALSFTEWNRYDMLSRMLSERVEQPPFTGQANHEEHVKSLRRQLDQSRGAAKPVQLQRAARQAAEAVARRPDDPDLRWNLAHLLDLNGEVANAETEWRAVIRMLPHAPLPYHNLAKLLETHGRATEARPLYEQCLRLRPDLFEARYSLGVLLSRQGQPAEAVRHLQKAVQSNPNAPAARLELGLALQQTSRKAEAEHQFREVLRLQPENALARKALGSATP